jgi:hypothetical protein
LNEEAILKMNLKRYLLVLLALALALVLPVSASAGPASTTVSQAEALNAARSFIAHLSTTSYPDWQGADATGPTTFTDEADAARSIVFTVTQNGSPVGYVTVSATKDGSPFLESSTGRAPQVQVEKAKASLTASLAAGDTLGAPQLLHLSALAYLVKFPVLRSSRQVDTLYYDLGRDVAVKADELPSVSIKTTPDKARAAWDHLATLKPSDFTINYALTRSLSSNVGNFNQDHSPDPGSNCGPTSGANIIQYWHNTSYSGLGAVTEYGGESNFIDHMRGDMGTWPWGTTVGQFVDGMNLHLKAYSVARSASSTISPNTTYSQLTSEIGYNRPVGIKIDSNSLGSNYYSYHWVTGVGYDVNTNLEWHGVIIHNSYSTVQTIDYDTYQPYLSFVYVR